MASVSRVSLFVNELGEGEADHVQAIRPLSKRDLGELVEHRGRCGQSRGARVGIGVQRLQVLGLGLVWDHRWVSFS